MLALLAAAGSLLALMLFGRLPIDGLWAIELQNSAHGSVFAALALIVIAALRRLRPRSRGEVLEYATAFVVTLSLGALVEGVQALIGRDAEVADLLRDALGAIAALGFLAFFERSVGDPATAPCRQLAGSLLGAAALVALITPPALCALAYRERHLGFPVLADFDRPYATYFVATHARASATRDALPPDLADPAGRRSGLRVQPGGTEWWGVSLREPRPDWSDFQRVGLAIANPAARPLRLRVRIHDDLHRSGGSAPSAVTVTVAPRTVASVFVPLRPVAVGSANAALDLANVKSLMLSRSGKNRTQVFYVLRVWLE